MACRISGVNLQLRLRKMVRSLIGVLLLTTVALALARVKSPNELGGEV
jgi:hypothetical protein